MIGKSTRWFGYLSLPSALLLSAAAYAQKPQYPATRSEDVVDTIHGQTVRDPYRWLEKSEDAQVQAWQSQQNALTRRLLDQFPELRANVTKRIEALYGADFPSAPEIREKRYFFTRREGTKNHPILYMRDGGADKPPKLVIDPNAFSDDGTVALDWWYPSPDGTWIAYGKSASGNEKSTLYLREAASATDLALTIPFTRSCTVAWDKDAGGFLYARQPEPGSVPAGDENYYRHVYYHKFGTEWRDDPKLFGEGAPKEQSFSVASSSDRAYQFVASTLDWAKNDLYFRKSGEKEFQPIAEKLDGRFSADVLNKRLIILTNYQAPRYRVLTADVATPGQQDWTEIIPQQDGVIQSVTLAGGKLVLNVLQDVTARLFIHDPDGKLVEEITLPMLGAASGVSGKPDSNEMYFNFQSFVYPPTVFQFDLAKHELKPLDKPALELNPEQFETAQVWFKSKDGTRVPMFVVHKKGLARNGDNPCILYGYGGFNISVTPTFQQALFPWLDRGGVFAAANIRGGGEFGREWHLAGRLANKQKCFDDMIAAAEKLIADKYTSARRLGARGGSNGGLLMGGLLTQRPDLFRAIVCQVPLLDMLRYHSFSIARLWIPEYGTADDAEQFKTLWAYSPYQHVKPGEKYPAVLFTTAESDSRVDPMHARKMTAAVQAASASDNPVLLWVESKAGHGVGKPLSKQIESQVDWLEFFMWQLGVEGARQ